MTGSGERDVAGVVAPPPLIYATALIAGFVLGAALPSFDLPGEVRWPIGVILVLVGVAFLRSFIAAFRRARTPVAPGSPTTALVTTGPYRISRNPAYLGFALLYAGIATLAEAPWAYATLLPALVVVDRMVIAREERYLERRFGDEYLRYKATTRRWV
jgi:protein-S-isoprenylcysteine O-methyltransferase Ste14